MTFVLRYSKNEFEGTQILISIILSCHAHLTIWPVLIELISKPVNIGKSHLLRKMYGLKSSIERHYIYKERGVKLCT